MKKHKKSVLFICADQWRFDCFSFLNGDLPLPPLTPERALQTEKFVHALYASNEQGGWVDLSENRESKRLGKQIDA